MRSSTQLAEQGFPWPGLSQKGALLMEDPNAEFLVRKGRRASF